VQQIIRRMAAAKPAPTAPGSGDTPDNPAIGE
jgi:hypothetical protein